MYAKVESLCNDANNGIFNLQTCNTCRIDSNKDDTSVNKIISMNKSKTDEDSDNAELFGVKKGFLIDSRSEDSRKKTHDKSVSDSTSNQELNEIAEENCYF